MIIWDLECFISFSQSKVNEMYDFDNCEHSLVAGRRDAISGRDNNTSALEIR
ncbi:hypothetical protein X777_14393 [Ooceraea biroi]|uniref:Uncharacterized protein n=1 Tax=Ooceraea biroi TaxID=2015173 RepID=A0A026WVW1_OOCBI|nr:hypothetical protein X777_14393 [Ooceraea biroi]